MVPITSSVAELMTSIVPEPFDGTHSPPMKILSRTSMGPSCSWLVGSGSCAVPTRGSCCVSPGYAPGHRCDDQTPSSPVGMSPVGSGSPVTSGSGEIPSGGSSGFSNLASSS